MKTVTTNNISFNNGKAFTLIAGPCQMETEQHTMMMAEKLKRITDDFGIGLVYKSSFDKANRTSISGKRGIGLSGALPVFAKVKAEFNLPVLTDVHEQAHIDEVADIVDIMQIPAFLCRQTDLLVKAGNVAKAYNSIVNVKKGQFLAPWDMANVVKKVESTGCENILLTERGASFGYNTLVSDMRSLPIMAETGYPVIYDATHSVQAPGGMGGASGGNRAMVPTLAKAAVAVGVAGLFMEVHQDPDNAPSDGPCMVVLDNLADILKQLQDIDTVVK